MAVDGYCCHPSNPRYGGADDTDDRRYESEVHELCPLRKSELLIVIEGWRR
jgi:hypothetical protein